MLTLSILTLGAAGVMLSSCGKDEPTTYQLSFSKTTYSAHESDGTLSVDVTLDKEAPQDLTVKYTVAGTTTDETEATNTDPKDFAVDGDFGKVVIPKGSKTGTIKLDLYSDDLLEDDETIDLTISSVDPSANVQLTTNQSTEIKLQQEDGIVVLLKWPDASTDGVADMDLLARMGATSASYDGILTGSVFRGYNYNYEFVFIPKTFIGTYFGLDYTNSTYGLTYTYYDGSFNPLAFTATFIEFTNGALEPEANRDVYNGQYTAANKNKWVSGTPPTLIEQTFQNVGGSFTNISDITVPESSSRVASKAANTILSNGSSEGKLRVVTVLPNRLKDLIK